MSETWKTMQRDALRAALTSLLCRNKKPIYQKNVDGSEGTQTRNLQTKFADYRACPELSSRRVLHERLCGFLPASQGARNYATLEPRGPWPKTVLSAVAFLGQFRY